MRFAAALLLLASSLSVHAQSSASDPPGGKPLPWDTISIHVTDPAHADNGYEHDEANGLTQHAMTMDFFIASAYTFTLFPSPEMIEGLPGWVGETKFDVEARVAPENIPAYKKLTSLSIPDTAKAFAARQYTGKMLMDQDLLTERFHIKTHTEMRERNVFLMSIAKGGIRMKPAADPEHGSVSMGRGRVTGKGVPTSFIASFLAARAGGLIVDQTGDHGQYDFELHHRPKNLDAAAASASDDPDFFTAVQEQLGLKLTRGKAQVPIVVIDHIDKPSEN